MPFRRRAPAARMRGIRPKGDTSLVLTASGERADAKNSAEIRTLFQPWQITALTIYSSVGEAWYAAQFYARSLSKLRLYVGRRDGAGEIEEIAPKEDKDGNVIPLSGADLEAVALLERIQDPGGGGRGGLLGTYGRLMFLIGEALLTVTGGDTADERWEFLSPLELRPIPGGKGYVRQGAPGLTMEQLTAPIDESVEPSATDATVWRVWRRHPTWSKWADSPMNAVLLLFEELELLQLAVRARAKARANRGLLYISNDITFGTPDGQGDEDAGRNAFAQDFSETLISAVKDAGSPSSVVPYIVFGPSGVVGPGGEFVPAKDLIFPIRLIDPDERNDEEIAKTAIIKRIAIGLDLPPEILTGMSDVNHWGAWQIDEASWTAHVQPMADQLVQDLSDTYLRDAAEAKKIEGWEDLVIGYDASDVINHPDRTNDVREAYRDGVAGSKIYLETIGLTEEDGMDEKERNEFLLIKLRGAAQLADISGQTPDGVPVDAATVSKTPPEVPTIAQQQDEESTQSLGGSGNGHVDEREFLVQRIVGAADLAVERTREIAGSRLVQKARGCDDCKEKIADVPTSMVAAALGHETALSLAPGVILTEGGTTALFASLARSGVETDVAMKLCQLVESHARESLFASEPEPLPPAFEAYVRRVT